MDNFVECQSSEFELSCRIGKPNNDDETAEEQFQAELPPQEVALSLDHILEQIFSSLSTSDLLTCRLVSHRFLQFAQVPLEKRLSLVFLDNELSRHGEDSSGRTLKQLTEFLEQSSSSQIPFPCIKFSFFSISSGMSDTILQEFLDTSGRIIRQLTFCTHREHAPHETIFIYQLAHLLISQAPHLEYLCITTDSTVEWQQEVPIEMQEFINEMGTFRSSISPLLKTDPEFEQISTKVASLQQKSSLKSLKIHGGDFAKILEFLFQISPQLQKVNIPHLYNIYFLYPVCRLQYLTKLEFDPLLQSHEPYYSCILETIEKLSKSKESKVGPRTLDLSFRNLLPMCENKIEFGKRVVSVFNKLMELSQDTLEDLTLTSLNFLPGMKMPSMTQLRQIEIKECSERYDTIFPRGFSWLYTFPNLACVKLSYDAEGVDFNSFHEFLNCLDFQGKYQPALSLGVKKVILSSHCFGPPEDPKLIPTLISEKVQNLFPCARILANIPTNP